MSTTYRTIEGDSFGSIARKVYGVGSYASNIAAANPGVSDPPPTGIDIVVPEIPDSPTDKPQSAPAVGPDETALLIDSKRFRFWESVTLTRRIDGIDSVEFTAAFDPSRSELRETFRPFSYRPMAATVGGTPELTGTLVSIVPEKGEDSCLLNCSGYSKPGILADCTMPASSYPLEFNGQNLRDIARTLAKPFGLSVKFEAPPGDPFEGVSFLEGVSLEPDTKILDFLADLAKQRNLVVGNDVSGALVFRRAAGTGAVVARLREGESPLEKLVPQFNGQEYYSHVSGLSASVLGFGGESYTVKNPRLNGVLRPLVYKPAAIETEGLAQAVRAKVGRMFANAVSYVATLATWRTPDGELWAPGMRLTVTFPSVMIYSEYELVVREVARARNGTSKSCALTLVLPESFSGKIPERMPWEG